jgi:tripartite-type tricarboxylate transporter receptor subunit TctC
MNGLRSIIVTLMFVMPLASVSAGAQEVYSGKTITIVVGVAAGGGVDAYARLLSRHFGHHIPGTPTIIVQNMPGAGSLNAVMSLEATAAKDGTVVAAFNPGLVLESLTSPDRIKANFAEFSWLGSIASQLRVCYMWGTTGIKTWDDMLKRPRVVVGDTGPGGGAYTDHRMLSEIFGVKIKQVTGYTGSAATKLAMESGELDGACGPWDSVPPDWVRDKKANFVLRYQKDVPAGFPEGVSYAGDLVKEPAKKQLLELLGAPNEFGRPYILSKSVPADRLKILREAFAKTMKDPQFLSQAEQQRMEISPVAGAAVEAKLKELSKTPAEIVAEAKRVLGAS